MRQPMLSSCNCCRRVTEIELIAVLEFGNVKPDGEMEYEQPDEALVVALMQL